MNELKYVLSFDTVDDSGKIYRIDVWQEFEQSHQGKIAKMRSMTYGSDVVSQNDDGSYEIIGKTNVRVRKV